MGNAVKEKVTMSLDPELVQAVDREVRARHANSRSAVMEEALRLWQAAQRRRAIEEGVETYYQTRSEKERREDRNWTRLASRQTKRLWND